MPFFARPFHPSRFWILFFSLVKAAEMAEKHLEENLRWKRELTTAFLEGLNSLFSVTKRKARGFRSIEHLKTIYLAAANLG